MALASEQALRWDLSKLYAGPDDPRIDADLETLRSGAEAFADRYRGRLDDLSPYALKEAIEALEGLYSQLYQAMNYASLAFYADTTNTAIKALHDRLRVEGTAIANRLRFFDIELKGMAPHRFEHYLESKDLEPYRYFLRSLRRFAPHTLSEPEEKIAALKDVTGLHAWTQLYDEISSRIRIPLSIRGETRDYTVSEARALRSDPDREIREKASRAVLEAYAEREHVLTYLFNTVYQDHVQDLGVRHYDSTMSPTLLEDDLDEEVVEALMGTVEGAYDLVQEYYQLKARYLQISEFASYDTLAPYGSTVRKIPFDEGRQIVLTGFRASIPRFADIASRFFEEHYIDVPPAPGKRGGAFCAGMVPGSHPYVLLNYNDRMDDVATLAHELGHGIHFVLAQKQSLFNYNPITPLAETASTFGEILIVNHLLATETDPQVRLQILAKRMEDAVGTIFRQVMYTRWEQRSRKARAEGVVEASEYSKMWEEEYRKLYGDSVKMLELDPWGWITIPHVVQSRFYCYSYAFGLLLVYALYQRYREEGEAFLPKLYSMLEAGGSAPPVDILGRVGMDIRDPGFWQRGVDALRGMLADYKAAIG